MGWSCRPTGPALHPGAPGGGSEQSFTVSPSPRESRGALGSRALSHDSIFIPESGQDPTRPVRVFSQENVCDRIKALQVNLFSAVSLGMYVKYDLRYLKIIPAWFI